MKEPSKKVQDLARAHVEATFNDYKKLTEEWRERMYRVYQAVSTFKGERRADWDTTFKVNKAHEIIRKVHPRLIAKSPRWIVTPAIDDFWPDLPLPEMPQMMEGEEGAMMYNQALQQRQDEIRKRSEKASEMAQAVQAYLTDLVDTYDLLSLFKLYALNQATYGKSWAKVKYKYETVRVKEESVDPETNEVVTTIKEDVVGEYPTIDVKSWTEVYFDPRYRFIRDMPAFIEVTEKVRLSSLIKYKDRYFNLNKLKDLTNIKSEDFSTYKQKVLTLMGIKNVNLEAKVDKDSLTLIEYYGYFAEADEAEEKIYKICVINNLVVIAMEEITNIPHEEISCFQDPETNFATGFVEPIISLQDEMNFKKNSASQYVNTALNRSYLWSPNSGINPKDLINKPNNIIVTKNDVQSAKANFEELPHREINSSFFQEQNDFERQIQSMSFTVDTANQKNQQALTNTATGIRVKFFESNSVIDEVRKNFERGLERLAYKLLQCTFEHMENNIIIKKEGAQEFWEINKEALRDAIKRYSIKIETNSSSFDDIESRREEATAFFNILTQAKQVGVNVMLEEGVKDVIHTFEKKDPSRFIAPPDIGQLTNQAMGGGGGMQVPPPPAPENAASELTDQVAQGNITSMSQL